MTTQSSHLDVATRRPPCEELPIFRRVTQQEGEKQPYSKELHATGEQVLLRWHLTPHSSPPQDPLSAGKLPSESPHGAPLAPKRGGILSLDVPTKDSQSSPCLGKVPLGSSQFPEPHRTPAPTPGNPSCWEEPHFLQHHLHHQNPLHCWVPGNGFPPKSLLVVPAISHLPRSGHKSPAQIRTHGAPRSLGRCCSRHCWRPGASHRAQRERGRSRGCLSPASLYSGIIPGLATP